MSETTLSAIRPQFWRTIVSLSVGCVVLGLVTLVCVQWHTRFGIVALLYLLTIVVISLQGRFFVALLCSAFATLGLDYFFTQPVFSLSVTRLEDIAGLFTFATIALAVSALGFKVRKSYWELAEENSQRKRAEEAWQKAQAELAHANRIVTLEQLASSITHEIKQALGAITNNARASIRFLATGSENLPDIEAALSDILKGADRVNSIIVRMRTLAKKVPPEMVRLNFTDLITDVFTLIQHELTRRQVEIEIELGRELPAVLADRVQMQQVLLNLVMNGVEAMNDIGGDRKMWIGAQPYEYNGDSAVLVSVRDSGCGLKQAEVDRLFEAFFTTKPQGLGMGLAISRSIVEAHGGRLWLASAAGPGATFEFVLPAKGQN